MVILDAALVFGVIGLVIYATIRLLTRFAVPDQAGSQDRRRALPAGGRWRTAHYDVEGRTHVVVQKISADGQHVLDEHGVETIRIDDPDFDARFLAAMARARERRALFETEEG